MTFGILAYALANQPKTNKGRNNFLVNFPIRYLGKISYSAYIWHFVLMSTISGFITETLVWIGNVMSTQQQVLFFCGFLSILLLITVILSTLTYRFIELPMIRLGNRLIKS
jgi:peptidoglycan/LPS O-acetylase OafA/YrhL